MARNDITWDDLTGAEKRAILRADARGLVRMFRGASSTPAADRRVKAVYDQAAKRIADGK